jgi:hypothetical protein
MTYTVWEEFFRWQWVIGRYDTEEEAKKVVDACPVGRHRWIDPLG